MKSVSTLFAILSVTYAFPQSLTEMLPGFGTKAVPMGPAPSGCNDLEIIIARGTSEPGAFGVIVGDPLVANVKKLLPNSRGYAVQYPADATPNSAPSGAADVVKRLTSQSAACPNQKFALVGYSQGGRVLHMALPKVDKAIYPKIVGIAVFGDPGQRSTGTPERPTPAFPDELKAKVVYNCAKGDPACDKDAGTNFAPHLTYNSRGTIFQGQSAQLIVAGFKGQALPAVENNPVAPKGA